MCAVLSTPKKAEETRHFWNETSGSEKNGLYLHPCAWHKDFDLRITQLQFVGQNSEWTTQFIRTARIRIVESETAETFCSDRLYAFTARFQHSAGQKHTKPASWYLSRHPQWHSGQEQIFKDEQAGPGRDRLTYPFDQLAMIYLQNTPNHLIIGDEMIDVAIRFLRQCYNFCSWVFRHCVCQS